jgi:hypothetical protein
VVREHVKLIGDDHCKRGHRSARINFRPLQPPHMMDLRMTAPTRLGVLSEAANRVFTSKLARVRYPEAQITLR